MLAIPTYPLVTVIAVTAAVAADLWLFRNRLVQSKRFWCAIAIMFTFQVFVDGWLTRATDTIVIYDEAAISGVRVFWNTPIEDFGFGFAMILLTLDVWKKLT